MAIIQGNAKQGSTRGFYPKTLEGSLRFNDDDSAYLSWTAKGGISERRTFTISCWVKKAKNGSQIEIFGTASEGDNLYFTSGDQLGFFQNGSADAYIVSNAKFRDPSAWYHIVCAVDTTQATASNRVKLYVNGEQITSFSSSTYPAQDNASFINNTVTNFLGKGHGSQKFDGYIAEFFMVAGTQHDADAFGETKNGVWVPKNITASDFTMGTNGFYLNFLDDTQVEAFNTVLWRGNSVIGHQVTGVGFEPDLVWMKIRSGQSDNHVLHDAVRGSNRRLFTNSTNAETYAQELISFDSDGFTLGSTDGSSNYNGFSYVGWCWDAGANNAVTGHSSVTYTGNGGTQKISGLPFSPDLVWIKDRSNARDSVIFDTVRGAANYLRSASTAAEGTSTTTLSSFDKDGFILGNNAANNNTSETYVAWGWDAGDSDPVSNTAGSITSTVKASTTNGFSIVSYTGNQTSGATVGHGLSSAPDMIIVKNRDSGTDGWPVYHSSMDATNPEQYWMRLNGVNASTASSSYWNDTAPSSSYVTLGSSGWVNGNSQKMIMYCFHDVTGKQKFGTYEGDGTDDGTQEITTGFRPGFLLVKNADDTYDWIVMDSSRDPLNPVKSTLLANATNDENATINRFEFTDTGFKVIRNDSYVNATGNTYIYAAFAGSYSDYITDYNTDGSIDSRVKANDTTGFSIVSYTGTGANATWGHGLSSAPDMVIVKRRTNGLSNWHVYHSSLAATQIMELSTTAASQTDTPSWNSTAPTNSVVSVGTSNATNMSGESFIAYCWTETTGYSKFGSYNGDSTTDGSHEINVGFKPAMVIIKHATGAYNGDWFLYDNTRDVPNGDSYLRPNLSSAETANGGMLQLTDTGFAFYTNSGSHNQSGFGYIYAAFADTREAAFWLDQSGNDNDWQPVNLDHNDTVADSPTNNFATWNPLIAGTGTFADGNLSVTTTVDKATSGTILSSSGQHYCEIICTSATTIANARLGVVNDSGIGTNLGGNANTWAYLADARVYHNGSASSYGTTLAVGDVFQIALDIDAGKVWYGINGTWMASGDPSTGDNPSQTFTANQSMTFAVASGSGTFTFVANFGQQPFKYDPPA